MCDSSPSGCRLEGPRKHPIALALSLSKRDKQGTVDLGGWRPWNSIRLHCWVEGEGALQPLAWAACCVWGEGPEERSERLGDGSSKQARTSCEHSKPAHRGKANQHNQSTNGLKKGVGSYRRPRVSRRELGATVVSGQLSRTVTREAEDPATKVAKPRTNSVNKQ